MERLNLKSGMSWAHRLWKVVAARQTERHEGPFLDSRESVAKAYWRIDPSYDSVTRSVFAAIPTKEINAGGQFEQILRDGSAWQLFPGTQFPKEMVTQPYHGSIWRCAGFQGAVPAFCRLIACLLGRGLNVSITSTATMIPRRRRLALESLAL